MQSRLPARLAAPKLLSLAHVISLEQSRERERERGKKRGEGEKEGRGGGGGADLSLSRAEGLAQGVWVQLGADIKGDLQKWRIGLGLRRRCVVSYECVQCERCI